MSRIPIERALLSVSDKTGLVELGQALVARGVELISSGGTSRTLQAAGLPVTDVADYTGFPEMMDGRVKTLHPKIHGGILCRRNEPEDLEKAREHGIRLFDLVIVNLYPFAQTAARPGITDPEVIEQIDIGGPSLVRGAAKNHAFVAIVTDPGQYAGLLESLAAGGTTLEERRRLAGEAFAHTARYDAAIADYFERPQIVQGAPATLRLELTRRDVLRYGENPHQPAAVYEARGAPCESIVRARKIHGKELSYNNLLDLDAALSIVRLLSRPAAVVVKHNNPCGAAEADRLSDAMQRAIDGDPLSAFGGIVALNRPLDLATADVLCEPGRFIEAIVAPDVEPAALEALTTRPKWKANVRILITGPLAATEPVWELRPVSGGGLYQQADVLADDESAWRVVTDEQPSDAERAQLRFAWNVCRFVKSNAILLARDFAVVGVGAGQMSRVDSVRIALEKAGERSRAGVLASDAFFPFPDSIELAAAAGVRALIQPGGSKQDEAVIAACNQHRLAMIFTGRRHFKH